MSTPTFTVEMLRAHGDWMRRLAGHLVAQGDASDFVQDAWRAALESPPDASRPLRPWLAQVLRNTIRSAFRRDSRRRTREREQAAVEAGPADAEEAMARAQLHHRIAHLMTTLDEPYRSTLVARFYEGLDATEIGRRSGVPSGTVRWRIQEGVQRLRAALDESHGGERQRWRVLLLPTAAGPEAGGAPPGVLRWSLGKTAAVGVVAAALVTGGLAVRARATRQAARALPVASGASDPGSAARPNDKEATMTRSSINRAAALVGAALPALAAGAQAQAAVTDDAVSWCVEMREKVFACKEEFAEAFVARRQPPSEQRMALWGQALQEIADDGSGALEPRQRRCRAWMQKRRAEDHGGGDARAKLEAMTKMLATCAARTGCKARVECMLPFIELGPAPAPGPSGEEARLGNGRVVGRVVDSQSGAAVANVEVRLLAINSNRKLVPVRSDASGAFVVEGAAVGEPVKLVFVGERSAYVVERRRVEDPQASLDLGTVRLMPGNLEARFREGTWRGWTGIKVREDESATVMEVASGSPADRAGVRRGDKLLAIGAQPLRGLPFGGVEWHLRGRPGTSVAVTVQTGTEAPRTVTLSRIPD